MLVEKKVVAAIPEIVVEHESKLLYVLITPVFATLHYQLLPEAVVQSRLLLYCICFQVGSIA